MKRSSLLLAAAIVIGLSLRLAPLAITGYPFDNDSWYVHHDVRVLESDPAARVYSDPRMDSYHNRWPTTVILATIFKSVTGLPWPAGVHVVGPLLDGIALVPFYALARRLGATPLKASLATIVVAVNPSMVLLGGGLVKEAVARPFLYAYPIAAIIGMRMFYPLLAMGVVLSHHLTSIVLAGVLALSHVLAGILSFSSGRRVRPPDPLATIVLIIIIFIYMLLIGRGFSQYILSLINLYWLFIYIISLIIAIFMGPGLSGNGILRGGMVATLLVAVVVLVVALAGLAPGIQPSLTILYYVTPALILIPTLSRLTGRSPPSYAPLPLAWITLLAAATGYLALAGNPMGQSPVGRLANLALPGLALSASITNQRMLLRAAAVTALLLGPIGVVATLTGADPVSFDLPYHNYEVATVNFALEHGAEPLYGDAKMRDLAYFLSHGKIVVKRPYPEWGPGYLILYKENLRWGFKLDANIYTGETKPLLDAVSGANASSLLYSTGESWLIYSGRPIPSGPR